MEGITMKCPKCQSENPESNRFCGECGGKLEIVCPSCKSANPSEFKFCGKCGKELPLPIKSHHTVPDAETPPIKDGTKKDHISDITFEGERKQVTALFSDLSGYTTLTEKLDPEEVKEITSRIFDGVSQIISNYEGFIEKFAGDAVMALFGVAQAHEDDPVRAIRAAIEIHNLVVAISPEYERKIGEPLTMHTGINTGLVVTGEVNFAKGTHGVAGDTVNVASRLSGLGNAGDILIGRDTYMQSEGYFDFEDIGHSKIKGRVEPVRIYKVLAPKVQPVKVHRFQGLVSKLIGRRVEMDFLAEAVQSLRDGKGSIISICGTAGTGKSRLIEEFRSTLNLVEVQWIEGHAYPYTQNIPYYLLINLLSRTLLIEEGDAPDKIREKIEISLSNLIGENSNFIPYIGSLYALSYPEIDDMDPEFWKSQLQKAVQAILSSVAKQGPTIICLEDLHWADPSFLELIRKILTDFREPIFFLCIYRPVVTLFTSHQLNSMANSYKEIRLQDLSPSESHKMVESLLKTDKIPSELKQFVQDKVEGNPFYVEEMINSLIESETLLRDSEVWKLTRPITESEISPTIHGVIAGRLDRLEKETKQILQEASVIGRAFLYEILKRITLLQDHIDTSLNGLERLDLLRTRSVKPDLEYIFKHALTQDVVYNGLLKSERKVIHERIGLVMEQLFKDRLPEFYETIAFHFSQARSLHKAVEYLIKSGVKSLKRYAVEESHQYYQQAYNLLTENPSKTKENLELLFDLLNKWSLVYYYRGDFKEQTQLLKRHESEAAFVKDKEKLAMFYGWLGFVLQFRWELEDSVRYLQKAVKLGEEADNKHIIGYAYTWLTYAYAPMVKYKEGYMCWEKAVSIAKSIESDSYLYFKSIAGISHIEVFSGDNKHSYEIGNQLLDYGMRYSNIRSQVVGHICIGHSHYSEGNMTKAISSYQKAIEVAEDPFYTQWPRLYLGSCYVLNEQIEEGEKALNEVATYVHKFGCDMFSPVVMMFLGLALIKKGEMSKGLQMIEETYDLGKEKKLDYGIASTEFMLGNVYYEIAYGEKPSLSIIRKNAGFLAKNIPFASKKAERYFKNAIKNAKRSGVKGFQGLAYLRLGHLYKAKKRNDLAKKCLSDAIKIFEECKAKVYLEQANEALKSLQ
jgi:class 3 adenylate cyclase/tetratricopeptide (TPR) repeat protein